MVYRERWDTVLCGQHGFGASMASAISFVLELLAMAEILLRKSKDSLPDRKRKKNGHCAYKGHKNPVLKLMELVNYQQGWKMQNQYIKSLVFLYTSTEHS